MAESDHGSILRRLFWALIGFGLSVGAVFPLYAHFFVVWKAGMLTWFVVGCLAAGSSIGLAAYGFVKGILLRKMSQMAEVVSAVASQDLRYQCTIKSNDMVGDMATQFNNMTVSLRNVIKHTIELVQELDTLVGRLQNNVRQTREGTQQQQSETERMTDAFAQLGTSVGRVAGFAQETSESTQQVNKETEEGKLVITEAMGAIENLVGKVDLGAQAMEGLARQSDNIGKVLDVIRGIAEQTNLLALNAAIEAARAGEQGRGFAVVADEVRALANKTHASTREIQEMIEALQNESGSTLRTMRDAHAKGSESVDFVERAAVALSDISGSVQSITNMSRRIAEATGEQRVLVQEVNKNIESINDVADRNAGLSVNIAGEGDSLLGMMHRLKQLVERFKV